MPRVIQIADYDPEWVEAFSQEAAMLHSQLGAILIDAHHIGSTAVRNLAAKPVIDILLVVSNLPALDTYDETFRRLGYRPEGENGIEGRRFYHKGGDERSHHLHAFEAGSPHIGRHVCFRDYLNRHPDEVAAYGALKKRLAEAFRTEPQRYVEAKSDFVNQLERKALLWHMEKEKR